MLITTDPDITWRLKRFGRIEAAIINDLFDKSAQQEENQVKTANNS